MCINRWLYQGVDDAVHSEQYGHRPGRVQQAIDEVQGHLRQAKTRMSTERRVRSASRPLMGEVMILGMAHAVYVRPISAIDAPRWSCSQMGAIARSKPR